MSRGHPNSPWTDERNEQLKKLWNDGLSASQCAAKLGLVSRNAVISKVHRLGLSGRLNPLEERKLRASRAKPQGRSSAGSRFNPTFSPKSRPSKAPTQPVTYEEVIMSASLKPVLFVKRIERKECAWPLWGNSRNLPEDKKFCCGNPIAPGVQSYCACHARMSDNLHRPRKEAA